MDNHEDEEDENSGYKIHHHLQHQDHDVKRGQGFAFVFVTKNLFWRLEIIKSYFTHLILTMETVIVMKENNIETVLRVTSSFMSMSLESKT